MPQSPLAPLLRRASNQYGLFSRSDAVELGATRSHLRRLAEQGVVEPVHRQVLRVCGSERSWHQRTLAAVLAGGPECVASHRTAAALLRLDGFPQQIVEISIRGRRDYRQPMGTAVEVHHTSVRPQSQVTRVGVIPVTTPERTVFDLAAVCARDAVVRALDSAERDGKLDRKRLSMLLEQTRASGRNGVTLIDDILSTRERLADLPFSVLERAMRALLQRSGLAAAEGQVHWRRRNGADAWFDFAYPQWQLAIEVDGNIAHALPQQRAKDHRRDREAIALGWTVLRFTREEVIFDGPAVAVEIQRALERLGAFAA